MSQHDALMEREPLLRTSSAQNPTDPVTQRDDILQSKTVWQRFVDYEDKLCIAAVSFCFFVTGLNATDVGALLIQLESYYDIRDGTAALIFMAAVIGSLSGIFLLPFVLPRYGWRGLVLGACMTQIIAIILIASGPPFPLFLFAVLLVGVGAGSLDAGCCAWASKVPAANIVQGFMHGSFSIGSILGPIACVAVIKNNLMWYWFHRFLLPFLFVQLVFLVFAFRKQDGLQYRETHLVQDIGSGKGASRTRIVYMCGFFYFFYLPVEASFTNWIPAYMKRIRHVDIATASYASSSFWAGMAIGRFALGPVTEHFGLNLSVTTYIILATIFQVIFRIIQHTGLSLVLLGIVGFFLAPMYPSAIILIGRKLSMQDYIGGVAAAAAIGNIGGAGSQWIIGFMSEKLGLGHLVDVVLFCSIILLVAWTLFTRVR